MKNKSTILWILLAFIVILWILYPFILIKFINEVNFRGLFGDSYGALNTLFSGFAFAALIFTIVQQNTQLQVQKEELVLQRKELELTRIELSRSAKAQESTEKSIKNQALLMEYSSRLDGLKTLYQTYKDNSKNNRYSFSEKQEFENNAIKIEKDIEQLIDNLAKTLK